MTDSAIAARIVNALEAGADREAGGQTALISVTIDMLARADAGAIEAKLVRKTRTLVFMSAEFRTDSGERIATASSVHKVRVANGE
jgi:acyl-coenzyme A thioesterase PaaI-like protein